MLPVNVEETCKIDWIFLNNQKTKSDKILQVLITHPDDLPLLESPYLRELRDSGEYKEIRIVLIARNEVLVKSATVSEIISEKGKVFVVYFPPIIGKESSSLTLGAISRSISDVVDKKDFTDFLSNYVMSFKTKTPPRDLEWLTSLDIEELLGK